MSGYICPTCQGKGIISGVLSAVVCSYCKGEGTVESKEYWKGIGKLTEECGELLQIAGKAIAFPVGEHPDKCGDVRERFVQEIADVYAALDYFCDMNGLDKEVLYVRRASKLRLFFKWGLSGIVSDKEQT